MDSQKPKTPKQEFLSALQELHSTRQNTLDECLRTIFSLDTFPDGKAWIKNIYEEHANKGFLKLFKQFRPYLFDILKRREKISTFKTTLLDLAKNKPTQSSKLINKLQTRDYIVLLLESCSPITMIRLGFMLANSYCPLPLLYSLQDDSLIFNLDVCRETLFHNQKPLITSIGTTSTINKGKSAFLRNIFSTKYGDDFSSKNGLSHPGSIDLHVTNPNRDMNFIIADVHGLSHDKTSFEKAIITLFNFSAVIVIHIMKEDLKNPDLGLKWILDILQKHVYLMNRGHFMVVLRDVVEKHLNDDDDDGDDNNDEDGENTCCGELESDLKALDSQLNEKFDKRYLGYLIAPSIKGNNPDELGIRKNVIKKELFPKLSEFSNKKYFLHSLTHIAQFHQDKTCNQQQYPDTTHQTFSDLITRLKNFDGTTETQDLERSLLPFSSLDRKIVQKENEEKILISRFSYLSNKESQTFHDEVLQLQTEIHNLQKKKATQKLNEIVLEFVNVITSKNFEKHQSALYAIEQWKTPMISSDKEKLFVLYDKALNPKKNDEEAKMTEAKKKEQETAYKNEIKKLEEELNQKDIAIDTLIDEMKSAAEITNQQEYNFDGLKSYLTHILKEEASPLNLINGNTLKCGSKLLEEILKSFPSVNQNKVYVISVIGPQSSAKSTLMNYLFGCGFATSAGRCTKGLFITLLKHPSEWDIIVIDTEGLMAVAARDHIFDNQVCAMTFSISNIVIINNKGEVNAVLRKLLEICAYAMKILEFAGNKPTILWALRDIQDNTKNTQSDTEQKDIQKKMLIDLKDELRKSVEGRIENIDELISISENDIFLFPSAFQITETEEGVFITEYNTLFSKKALEMREAILNRLTKYEGSLSLHHFYTKATKNWEKILSFGQEIMKAKTLLEINCKEEAYIIINEISLEFKKKLEESAENIEKKLKQMSEIKEDDFEERLNKVYENYIDDGILKIKEKIFDNSKFNSLVDSLEEFNLKFKNHMSFAKQNHLENWNLYFIQWVASKKKNHMRSNLRTRLENLTKAKGTLNEQSISELAKDLNELKDSLTNEYVRSAEQILERKKKDLVGQITDLFHNVILNYRKKEKKTFEYIHTPIDVSRLNAPKRFNNEDLKKCIKTRILGLGKLCETLDLEKNINEFRSVIDKKCPATLTKDNVETLVMECKEYVETLKEKVELGPYSQILLLEAIHILRTKCSEVAEEDHQWSVYEIHTTFEEETKYLQDVIAGAGNVARLAETNAIKYVNEVTEKFCSKKLEALQTIVLKKIQDQFNTPTDVNIYAYERSFKDPNKTTWKDYISVLKYIVDINKYIQELYKEKCVEFVNAEIKKAKLSLTEEFTKLLQQVYYMADGCLKGEALKEHQDIFELILDSQKNKEKFIEFFDNAYDMFCSKKNDQTESFMYSMKKKCLEIYKPSAGFEEVSKYFLKSIDFISNLFQERQAHDDPSGLIELVDFVDRLQEKREVFTKLSQFNTPMLNSLFAQDEIIKEYHVDLFDMQIGQIEPFLNIFKSVIADQLNKSNIGDDIEKKLRTAILNYVDGKKNSIVGCEKRCPMCHNKCTLSGPHTDHQTNDHYLIGFSGTKIHKTDKVALDHCFASKNYHCKWFRNGGKDSYDTYREFLAANENDRTWLAHFPQDKGPFVDFIPDEQIRGWLACKKVLLKKYDMNDGTDPSWEDKLPDELRIPEDTRIDGYI